MVIEKATGGHAIALTGWLNRHQQAVTGCLIEENRVLKGQFEGQWLGFTDKQRQ